MTGHLYRIGGFCSRQHRPVIAVWILAAIALALPAIMSLFGKAAWWLPRPVDRALPRISIEGGEYFAARDARPPTRPAPAEA